MSSETHVRRLIMLAAAITLAGIALAATGSQELGSYFAFGGLVAMIYGLHRFGRLGPGEP